MRRRAWFLIALATTTASARLTTFAWDNDLSWPAGTTVELCSNGICANGITGTQHTLDVPIEPGQQFAASARSVTTDGQVSDWTTLVQTWPTPPVGQWAYVVPVEVTMAAFDNYAGNNVTATSIACNVPSGIADGYLMLALLTVRGGTPTGVPSGWDLVVSEPNVDGASSGLYLYEKIASSESGSYTWDLSASLRAMCHINSFTGVDTADPIDSYSSTAYLTNDAIVRSASVTTTAANQLVVNFAGLIQSTQLTFIPPTDFTEHHEYGGNRCWSEVSTQTFASAGATGNIDATMSASSAIKHGIAVVLNNVTAGGAAALPRRALDGPLFGALRGSAR